MKKYITLAALLAAGTAFANTGKTLHDTPFTTTSGPLQNVAPATTNLYIDSARYGNLSIATPANTIGGLFVEDTGGVQFNGSSTGIKVTYLYLASTITIAESTSHRAGEITWANGTGPNNKLNIQNNGWVDINNNYGSRIDVSAMTTGNIYLNTYGALTLSSMLSSTVNVHATIDTKDLDDFTRILFSGADFSSWGGSLSLVDTNGMAIDSSLYQINKTSAGLTITAIPEPSAFGLLAGLGALALVGTRRRRK